MKINIRILELVDVEESYVNWFSNADIVKYSINQYQPFTLEGQKSYVQDCLENDDVDLYGIFEGEKHIGNLNISGLSSVHKRAKLTYVIGEKSYWGKGIASFAIAEIIQRATTLYNLNKLYAACADNNIGSKKVLERNGFKLEGIRKKHLFFNNEWFDQLDFGLIL